MDFERVKNIKAGGITAAIVATLLLLAFLVSWTSPVQETPKVDEGMEVNLGNSETGMGDEIPMTPGTPADQMLETNTTPPPTSAAAEDPAKEVETNDEDKEAPKVAITKPAAPKKETIPIPKKETPPKIIKPKSAPVTIPTPATKKPAAVYTRSKTIGTGGNDADSYTKKNQGIAGGTGDQGKPGGNPDADNYTENGGQGNGSAEIFRGLPNRKITNPSFVDEFNENGKVAVDVKVSSSGKVISASFQLNGSTTSNPTLKRIALEKAYSLKFSSIENANDALGTVIFNFKIRD